MARRRILHGPDFVAAVRADLRYLTSIDRLDWVGLLDEDLVEVERLLAAAPRLGSLMERRGAQELRRLRLRRVPYVVWYVVAPRSASAPLVLLRLHHVRQSSPRRIRW